MPVGPYSQDVLTRIYNVHWGGGFVAGDNDSNVYFLEGARWENLGKLDFGKASTGFVQGSSYGVVTDPSGNANPVFVLVGGGGSTNAIGIIMASRDGRAWSRVFSFGVNSDTYTGANFFGVVWDEATKVFYAGGHQSDSFFDHDADYGWQSETDILFKSGDGYHWKEVSRHESKVERSGGPFPPFPEYKHGLLAAHCSKRVTDTNGNGLPDGNYGYDAASGILIEPTKQMVVDYLFGTVHAPDAGGGIKVTIDGGATPPPYPTDTGFPTMCVATEGSKWVAAGGKNGPPGLSQAAVLTFSENKYTWARIDPPGTSAIVTICAPGTAHARL